jgi:lysophospholipase L1-like esterase
MGGPPTDFTYPRVIERELLESGRNATVRNAAATSERVTTGLRNWENQIFPWSPDVVVLNYGLYEAVHLFLPQPLERHANSLTGRPGLVRESYRRYVLRPVWKTLALVQQHADARVPAAAFRRQAARFTDDVEHLVRHCLFISNPLVLLPLMPPAGERWTSWFPGIDARLALINSALAEVAARIDQDNVRVFDTPAAVAPLVAAGQDTVPDGGHFTPAAHDLIGRSMAAVIGPWCDENVPL